MRDSESLSGEGKEVPRKLNLLPKVTKETAMTLSTMIEKKDGKKYMGDILQQILEENEQIAHFITSISDASSDREMVAQCGILVYALLKNQAEADRLNKQLDI